MTTSQACGGVTSMIRSAIGSSWVLPNRLRKKPVSHVTTTTGAKAHTDLTRLRGPEGPLFHVPCDVLEFFRSLLEGERIPVESTSHACACFLFSPTSGTSAQCRDFVHRATGGRG